MTGIGKILLNKKKKLNALYLVTTLEISTNIDKQGGREKSINGNKYL